MSKQFNRSSRNLLMGVLVFILYYHVPELWTHNGSAAWAETHKASSPIPVEVTQPSRRSMSRDLRMPATLKAGKIAQLYAKTSGYVSKILVDIGSRVQKGDILLQIDVPEMGDELAQAQANLRSKQARLLALGAQVGHAQAMIDIAHSELARVMAEHYLKKITAERKEKLAEEKVLSPQALDESRGELTASEAQIKIAKSQIVGSKAQKQVVEADALVAQSEVDVAQANCTRLKTLIKYATVRAPFDGVITERLVDPGAFVRSATGGSTSALFTLAQVDWLRLSMDIPESDVLFVHVGTRVEISIKALGKNHSMPGTIKRTAVALNPKTRTMRAEVDLDNNHGLLAAGMYAQVTVKLETKQNALMIPSKSIRIHGRETSLLVVRQGVAEKIEVEIGYDNGIWAEIIGGELLNEDFIIMSTHSLIVPGTYVKAS